MISKSRYDAEIDGLEKQITALGTKQEKLEQARAEELCPHKVGDIITNTRNGKRTKITAIRASGWKDFGLMGADEKKDGTFGASRELWWLE